MHEAKQYLELKQLSYQALQHWKRNRVHVASALHEIDISRLINEGK
jgi:hypothetical protein